MLSTPDFVEDEERGAVHCIAPGQNNSPLSVFIDKDIEELAFIDIFCGQSREQDQPRKVSVHYTDIVKSELRRSDRRSAGNVDNIFFKTQKVQMKHLLDKTQLAMRKCKSHGVSLTAGTFKNQETMKDFIHQDIGYEFMKSLWGSPPYFEHISKELMSMIRALGPATFFCSFSAAETRWIHLLKILAKIVDGKECADEVIDNMSWPQKCRLIKSDPVTCARHFDYSVQCLLKLLKSPLQPIGDLVDYFLHVEFQHRGSPNIHMLVWMKDAPLLDTSAKQDIIDFIDRYITCERPEEVQDKNASNDQHNALSELVKFQLHRHSHTCKKGNSRKCRFNMPLPTMKETQILEPIHPENDAVDIMELCKSWQKI